MQKAIKKVSLKRIRVLMLVIFIGFAILGVKLMWVQLVKGNYYKEKALQYLQCFEDSPTRDAIEQFILLVANRSK